MAIQGYSLGKQTHKLYDRTILLLLGGLLLVFSQLGGHLEFPEIVALGWTAGQTWLAYHLFSEALAVVILFAGVFVLWGAVGPGPVIERMAIATAAVSCVLLIPTHITEHLFYSHTLPGVLEVGLFAIYPRLMELGYLAYYLSWVAFGGGLALFGMIAWWRGSIENRICVLLTLPFAVGTVGGLLAVWTGAYTFLGVHRLAHGLVWIGLGHQLYLQRATVTEAETDPAHTADD